MHGSTPVETMVDSNRKSPVSVSFKPRPKHWPVGPERKKSFNYKHSKKSKQQNQT